MTLNTRTKQNATTQVIQKQLEVNKLQIELQKIEAEKTDLERVLDEANQAVNAVESTQTEQPITQNNKYLLYDMSYINDADEDFEMFWRNK